MGRELGLSLAGYPEWWPRQGLGSSRVLDLMATRPGRAASRTWKAMESNHFPHVLR
jgi:hypothetical protein